MRLPSKRVTISAIAATAVGAAIAFGVGPANAVATGVNVGDGGTSVTSELVAGVSLSGTCNYALAAVGVNSSQVTFAVAGEGTAAGAVASTGIRCDVWQGGVDHVFTNALPGAVAATAGTFKGPFAGVSQVCTRVFATTISGQQISTSTSCR